MTVAILSDASSWSGLSAALGALVIAALNEWRARIRARTAELEREKFRAEVVASVSSTPAGMVSDEGAGASAPASSPATNPGGHDAHEDSEGAAVQDDPP